MQTSRFVVTDFVFDLYGEKYIGIILVPNCACTPSFNLRQFAVSEEKNAPSPTQPSNHPIGSFDLTRTSATNQQGYKTFHSHLKTLLFSKDKCRKIL